VIRDELFALDEFPAIPIVPARRVPVVVQLLAEFLDRPLGFPHGLVRGNDLKHFRARGGLVVADRQDKKFLIIGNINAISYKEIFKLIKENKAWLGVNMGRGISGFIVPKNYELYGTEARVDEYGNRIVATNNCLWLTNLDNAKRHEELILYKNYTPEEYPTYDNYDAINVDKTKDIPMDYKGAMGVPITFLDKFNPDQFEIIDGIGRYSMLTGPTAETQGTYLTMINGVPKYARIVIKNKKL
jgi:hypothetical protein